MIEVTRLNGHPMLVNSDLIKIAEASPDTMLTLIHGEKLIVRESCAEILEKVLAYRALLLAAVAANTKSQGDLHRLVALTSHNPDAYPANGGGSGRGGAVLSIAQTELKTETKPLESVR
jgi:flagellar protein FlbD